MSKPRPSPGLLSFCRNFLFKKDCYFIDSSCFLGRLEYTTYLGKVLLQGCFLIGTNPFSFLDEFQIS